MNPQKLLGIANDGRHFGGLLGTLDDVVVDDQEDLGTAPGSTWVSGALLGIIGAIVAALNDEV